MCLFAALIDHRLKTPPTPHACVVETEDRTVVLLASSTDAREYLARRLVFTVGLHLSEHVGAERCLDRRL